MVSFDAVDPGLIPSLTRRARSPPAFQAKPDYVPVRWYINHVYIGDGGDDSVAPKTALNGLSMRVLRPRTKRR